MEKDNVFTGAEARAALMRGVNKVADAVKGTLGAGGYNALLEDGRPPFTLATNDGVSVARAIMLADPVEQMGANLMKEIGGKSDKDGGDGTTTAITLAQAILQEGLETKASPMEVKRSLEECLPLITAAIDAQKQDITVDDVGKVATISAEDPKLGALIQEIYQKIGKDGILYTDISKTDEDYYVMGRGVRMEMAGLASPYMADTDDTGRFTKGIALKNPKILVTKQRISTALELNEIVTGLYNQQIKELVVFCDDIDATVIPDLVLTRAKSGFRTVVIKLPTIWKDHWFEDIALMTGATIIDASVGIGFKEAQVNFLGQCSSITADKNDTYFEGFLPIDDHIAKLEVGDDDDKIRAARLNTKSARLFVGAASDTALTYKRLKLEDARNAAWQALQGGVVAGGGVTLANIARSMPDTIGGNILRFALCSPMINIMTNAGIDAQDVTGTPKREVGNMGFDAKTRKLVDMFEAGIIDPANITKSSVTNAISVAGTVLSTKVIVVIPKVDNSVASNPQMAIM